MAYASDFALGRLLRIVDDMLSSIDNLRLQNQIRDELSKLRTQNQVGNPQENEVSLDTLRAKYDGIAKRYLELKQPFHWNIVGRDNSENTNRDVEQYLELIEFSAFVGSFEILEIYGFQSLKKFGGDYILAENSDFYFDVFSFWLSQNPGEALENYYEYGRNRFRELIS